MYKTLLPLFFALFTLSFPLKCDSARYAIAFNGLQTMAFYSANKIFVSPQFPKLVFLPFHFDAQIRLDDIKALSFGLVYRYENYHDNGPLYSDKGSLRVMKLWTNYHEVFMLAGMRFSPKNTGLEGLYFLARGGLGLAMSPDYFALSALAQPEVGYSFSFGAPGLRLDIGLGVLLNLPFYETIDFAVPWKKNSMSYSLVGILVHQAIPVLNLGLGFNW
ncbi:MAG: hypothetical protein KC505_08575 [Myxococcales bacterium]|nr:hypothetical protein [Myxococcales bacterium]USN50597.1 MAG: hypothetical protein H6731_10095 [Myxococcales bacterium]